MRDEGHKLAGGGEIMVLCFFLPGASGPVDEVVWLHLLGLVFGRTVYATTTVLAAFVAGLAMGSQLPMTLEPRIRPVLEAHQERPALPERGDPQVARRTQQEAKRRGPVRLDLSEIHEDAAREPRGYGRRSNVRSIQSGTARATSSAAVSTTHDQ